MRPFEFTCGDPCEGNRYLPGRVSVIVYLDDGDDLQEQLYELVSERMTWLEDADLARATCWLAEEEFGDVACLHIYDVCGRSDDDLLATLKPLNSVPVADDRRLEIVW